MIDGRRDLLIFQSPAQQTQSASQCLPLVFQASLRIECREIVLHAASEEFSAVFDDVLNVELVEPEEVVYATEACLALFLLLDVAILTARLLLLGGLCFFFCWF
jgi:hypothetical protein